MKAKALPIAITTGDHRGIGAEVIAKGIHLLGGKIAPQDIIIFGDPEIYKPYKKLLPKKWRLLSDSDTSSLHTAKKDELLFLLPHVPTKQSKDRNAYLCGRYIELATKLALEGSMSAIVTGPIDKNELHRGGFHYDGHTGMLKALCNAPSVTMMLAAPKMRVSLVTTHIALKDVSAALNQQKILTTIQNTREGLLAFGVKNPRLAVLGLNPHASDNGLFGDEEKNKIIPVIKQCQSHAWSVAGPFAADGFFANWNTVHQKNFDAIICMYHDQGLIPVKLYDFSRTVNVTLGLPIIRTSVDHGVGYDIAGKNRANPLSFVHALTLAKRFVKYAKK